MAEREPARHDSTRLSTRSRTSQTAAVETLLGRLETTEDRRSRAEILVDVAVALRDGLDDCGQAVDALIEAFRCDPLFEPVLDHLEPLLDREGRWPEVLEATRMLASVEREPARSLAYAETMARWLTMNVPQPELARQWVERIRGLDATHWIVHMAQAAQSREHGDTKREVEHLDRALLSARRKDDRARIHTLIGSRYEEDRTLNLVAAKKHYAAAHDLFPRSVDALAGLERIALREGDKSALASVLRRAAETSADDEQRIATLVRLAALEEVEFKKPDAAARTLESVVALTKDRSDVWDALERCTIAMRAWPALVSVLERAAAVGPLEVRKQRIRRLADLFESRLGDVRSAIASYVGWVAVVPDDETALGELARLFEKAGDLKAAVRYREALADATQDPALRARTLVIAGQILMPIDPAAARKDFEAAAIADPSNQAAWNALLWDARAANDSARLLGYLEQRAERTESPRARAACYVELAQLHVKNGANDAARHAWNAAAQADPSNEVAAAALVTILVAEGRHHEAEPLFEVALSAAGRDQDFDRLFALNRSLTAAASALGQPDRALGAAIVAFDIRAHDLGAREALVRAAHPMAADPQISYARDLLLRIADNPDGLSISAKVDLADVLAFTGDVKKAATLYDDVLAEEPEHPRALAGLAQFHLASGNAVAAMSLRRHLAMTIADPDERFASLLEVAEAMASRAKNVELAAEIYEDARKIRPNEIALLFKLLAIYQRLPRWPQAFDVLGSIAGVDTDPKRRSKTYFTMAQIAKDELADRGTALAYFEKALDVEPSYLEAFELIVQLLTAERDWPGLAQMYERMIDRVTPMNERHLLHALHKQLGLIRRDRLNDPEGAIRALRAAADLRPSDEEVQAMLRELLANIGQTTGAVTMTLERLIREPLTIAPYPALFDLLVSKGDRDRALCVASAMHFLDIPHLPAEQFRSTHVAPKLAVIPRDLGSMGFTDLFHEALDPALTSIFEIIAPAVVDIVISRLSIRERIGHPGPNLRGQDDLAFDVKTAAKVLGVRVPRLHARKTSGPALAPAPTRPASLLVFPPALAGLGSDVRAFLVGKHVCQLSPQLLARALCPSVSELSSLATSAIRIAMQRAEPADALLKERLRKDDLATIASAAATAGAKDGKIDVLRWSQSADVSASRAGLLLSGDLEAARAAIAVEPQSPGDLTPREKMRELVSFYLGDKCASLRKRLGVAIPDK